jgi:biotin carboxyl carrier protein
MDDSVLEAIVEPAESGRPACVRSPGIGWWSGHPRPGALVTPGTPLGTLTRLHRRFALVLPAGATGFVTDALPRDRRVAVEYGEPLFHLAPADRAPQLAVAAPGPESITALPAGSFPVVAPTDGTFYRRPGAAAAPFVEQGTRVRTGQPLGLVEVMKTFNQVLYGGPGFPDEAAIVEIRCEDAEEVHAGQVLFVVR